MLHLGTNFIVFELLNFLFLVLYWAIIARAFLSFAPLFAQEHYQFSRIVYQMTDWFMIPIENFMYKYVRLGQVDISPLVAIILLQFFKKILFSVLLLLIV